MARRPEEGVSDFAFSFGVTSNTPISGSYTYTYDRDRRLSSVTYPSGQAIGNFYLDGNLDSTVTPEGTISYSYDCGGKLSGVTKGTESTSYTYDGSLLLSDTRLGTVNEVIDYTYDTDMRVGSIGYAGGVESFVYDNDGLLTNAGPFTITRNVSNGLPEAVSDGTVVQGRVFSGYGEVDGVDYTVGVVTPYNWSVTRDNAGRITQKVENIGIDTVTWDYTYDLMGRLETVYKDNALAEAYSYDDNDNRTSENNILRGVTRSYTNSVEDHVLTAGADSYVFDVDGFLTSRTVGANTDTFNYSSRGELLSVTLSTGTQITYDHDPLGRWVAKRVNGTITEKYLWQDSTTLLAVYDAADTLIQRFSYADGRMPVSMTYQGAVYYLTYDQVGSLRAVTDTTGAIVKRVDYDSFGNILSDSNPSFTVPLGFAGGLHDRDTGLVRFGARDYDPVIGKWTAKDPIDFASGDLNLYLYSDLNPINLIDPLGLWGITVGGSALGIDFTATIYDSEKGWLPVSKTEVGVSTTLLGGGFQVYFDTGFKNSIKPEDQILVSVGFLSKYLGYTIDPELSHGSINIGLGLGLPITFSTSFDKFSNWLANSGPEPDICAQ